MGKSYYQKQIISSIKFHLGGARRDRTADPLRARQMLSQLSYGPKSLYNTIELLINKNGGPE